MQTRERRSPYESQFSSVHHKRDVGSVESEIRSGFVRKVMGIVLAQLMVTAATIVATLTIPAVTYIIVSDVVAVVASIVSIGCMFAMMSTSLMMRYPTNYYILGAFTASNSAVLARICLIYAHTAGPELIFFAALLTCLAVGGAYVAQSKVNMASVTGLVGYGSIALMSLGFARIFLPSIPMLHLGAAVLGVAVFTGYIIVDLHMILGKGTVRLDPDYYCIAAAMLYTDIIALFKNILKILEALNRDDRDKKRSRR